MPRKSKKTKLANTNATNEIAPPAPVEQPKKKFTGEQWAVLGTLMISSFLGRLDGSIVSLATPKIITDFGITVTDASYITTAYVLGNAVFVPVFGKLGDLIGRKPLYLFGIVGFVIASALAGLSWNLSSLLVFRVLQAITVSIDYPIALSIIAFEFTDRQQRLQAQGIWSSIFAAAIVFGPLLGGPLTDTFGWRSVFYVNIPLGAIGTFMAIRYIKEPVAQIKGIKHFDWLGSIVLGISLASIVLVLDRGQTWGWTSAYSIVSYIVSVVSMVLFIIIEQREKEPVVDLDFFKIPAFTIANIASFISMMGLFGGIFLIPIFAQNILGYSVTKSGYLFIPMAVGIMSGAQVGVRLAQKIPPRYFVSVGMFWGALMMYLFSGIDIKWGFWEIGLRLGLFAFGIGIGFGPLTQAAVGTVPIQEVGVASSVLALTRNLAGAFGTAIFATILSNATTSQLINIQNNSVINTTNPQQLQIITGLMEVKATILAYGNVFNWAAVFVIAGGIACLFLRETQHPSGPSQSAHVDL